MEMLLGFGRYCLGKYLMLKHLEAMRVELLFLPLRPLRSRKGFIREDSVRIRGHANAWMALDVISFVIGWRSVWRHPKPQYWTACFRDENGKQRLMCHSRASSSSLVVLPYRPNMTIAVQFLDFRSTRAGPVKRPHGPQRAAALRLQRSREGRQPQPKAPAKAHRECD
jgi:hypothetical protein